MENKENLYTINQVSKLLGISADAIRLYEKEGLLTPLRDPGNGYRYYTAKHIHSIYGIALYRRLDFGIQEIKKISNICDFENLNTEFNSMIDSTNIQIEDLKNKVKKLEFMTSHLKSLQEGIGTFSTKIFPKHYIVFETGNGGYTYDDMVPILSNPISSFGNFCVDIYFSDKFSNILSNPSKKLSSKDEQYFENNFFFTNFKCIIDNDMINICPLSDKKDDLPFIEECECIRTVIAQPEDEPMPNISKALYEYAKANGYICSNHSYSIYAFTLSNNDKTINIYEIFHPIIGKTNK